jgi:hypothetical protein
MPLKRDQKGNQNGASNIWICIRVVWEEKKRRKKKEKLESKYKSEGDEGETFLPFLLFWYLPAKEGAERKMRY